MSALRNLRQLTTVSRALARGAVARPAIARTAFAAPRAAPALAARGFSVSARVRGEGASDLALSQKLAEEIAYEREAAAQESGEPEFLKAFKAQGTWQIAETPGADEVTITRKFGNETIRLMFSIADVQNAPEEGFEPEEGAEGADEPPAEVYPIRCSFSITKSTGPGALNIDALCQDGAFLVDNVSFYPDASIGTDLTAEADWKRRGQYIGPQFDTLDVSVQEELERFLTERGIDERLALFVPEYAELKEQKEYVKWLENVKNFVDL